MVNLLKITISNTVGNPIMLEHFPRSKISIPKYITKFISEHLNQQLKK